LTSSNTCQASSCPNRFYTVSATLTCSACHTACLTCTGALITQCGSCRNDGTNDYYLQVSSTTCAQSCAAKQFTDTTNHVCTVCNTGCTSCSTSVSDCASCEVVASVNYFHTSTGDCATSCTGAYFAQISSLSCVACHGACSSCSDSLITTCTACQTFNSDIYYLGAGSTTCYNASCPNAQYISGANTCSACDVGCTACTSTASNCQSCGVVGSTNYYLTGSTCNTVCASGTYPELSNH